MTLLRDGQGRPIEFVVMLSDISARRTAEEALKAGEARFRGLFESALIGFSQHEIVLDDAGAPLDYVFLEANQAFGDYTGLAVAGIIGRRVTEVIPGVEASGLIELYGRVALGGGTRRFETYFEPLDRHYDIQVFSPQSGQFATVFLDVTERVRAQWTLEAFFDGRSVGLGILDRELRYVRVNDTLADIDQVSIGDHLGRTVQDVLPEHAADIAPALERALRGESVDGLEVSGGTTAEPDVDHHWLASCFPVSGEGGAVAAIGLVAIDISARRDAERDLEESRRFLRRVLDVTPDLIDIYDLVAQRNVFSNREMVEVLGYTPEEILEMGSDVLPKLLHPDDAPGVTEHHRKSALLANGQTLETECRMRRRDGTWCRLHSRDSVFRRAGDGTVIQLIGTAQDVTRQRAGEDARRDAERELAEMNLGLERRVVERTIELEAANEELEAFSYSVSHDLRAPLRALDGFSLALLQDCGEQLDETAKDYLARVRAAAQRMGRLIDDMLMLSRVTRREMVREKVDLSALARDILAGLRESQPERAVGAAVADGLVASGDPALLRIVLQSLLRNAW